MSTKIEFIDAEKATMTDTGEKKYTITALCEWLDVSTSGIMNGSIGRIQRRHSGAPCCHCW